MAERQSIDGEINRHRGLIPNASKIGNLVVSSATAGFIPGTYEFPTDFATEAENVFQYIKSDVEAAGGTMASVIKISFWLSNPSEQKAILDELWTRAFAEPAARPARHVHRLAESGRGRIHAEFMAVI